jgi:hypothetical protein
VAYFLRILIRKSQIQASCKIFALDQSAASLKKLKQGEVRGAREKAFGPVPVGKEAREERIHHCRVEEEEVVITHQFLVTAAAHESY